MPGWSDRAVIYARNPAEARTQFAEALINPRILSIALLLRSRPTTHFREGQEFQILSENSVQLCWLDDQYYGVRIAWDDINQRHFALYEGIYQEFYKQAEAGDRALLYTMRNIINRRDVKGSECVTKAYRSHHAFVMDCLQAFILVIASQHFGLENMNGNPTNNTAEQLLRTGTNQVKQTWILKQASTIRKLLLSPDGTQHDELSQVQHQTAACDNRERLLREMERPSGKYGCSQCDKEYVRPGNLVKHLKDIHSVDLSVSDVEQDSNCGNISDMEHEKSHGNARRVIASFCKMACLYLDTCDAYKMADGNRIFRNAKMEMLYAYSLKHTKYRLWLWRMLAYEMAVLTPQLAHEYKWNTCMNLKGGLQENIPNDNGVELQVGQIKKILQTQGSNKSFQSAQLICKTNQIVQQVQRNLQKVTRSHVGSRKRPTVKKLQDITALVEEISDANVFQPTANFATFERFQDPLSRIDIGGMHEWVKDQREIAAIKMVRNAHL